MGARGKRLGPAVTVRTSSRQDEVLGDGWVVAADGELRWGIYGAAGLLLRHTDEVGEYRYLVAMRSPHVHHGRTWGIPGGALHRHETPEDGARREAEEEFGPMPDYEVAEVIVHDFGGWTYSTVVGDVVTLDMVEPVTYEHTEARWVTHEEVTHLPLHPGLAGIEVR